MAVEAFAANGEKAVGVISGFSDGKFKTERELALCAAAREKSRRRHGGDRVRISSYFGTTGLGLVSWLALRYSILRAAACLGKSVLFDIAQIAMSA